MLLRLCRQLAVDLLHRGAAALATPVVLLGAAALTRASLLGRQQGPTTPLLPD
ncbi:hypothetical protein AB0H83_21160 [Dactylosporangium sp. NPDC050688]|uniref:hypothetical protein n=1 Tax=Dactylosporangium sp. NPDC050688 TaxID=3157217 RepID=UPI0033C81D72